MHLRDDERLVDHAAPLPGLLPLIPEDEPLEALRRLLVLPDDRGVGLGGVLIPHPIACDEARALPTHRTISSCSARCCSSQSPASMFHTPTAAYIPLPPFATLPTGASYTRIVEKAARRTLLPRTRQHEVPRITLLRTWVNTTPINAPDFAGWHHAYGGKGWRGRGTAGRG